MSLTHISSYSDIAGVSVSQCDDDGILWRLPPAWTWQCTQPVPLRQTKIKRRLQLMQCYIVRFKFGSNQASSGANKGQSVAMKIVSSARLLQRKHEFSAFIRCWFGCGKHSFYLSKIGVKPLAFVQHSDLLQTRTTSFVITSSASEISKEDPPICVSAIV